MIGKTFGRLTVVEDMGRGKHHRMYRCICICGGEAVLAKRNILRGSSCGCLKRERVGNANRKHGKSKDRLFKVWWAMKERCQYEKNKEWKRYGGRGISVCERWDKSFENFLLDMGPCPPSYQLDRINNDGNYEPGNCRWVTPKMNANNRRSNRLLTHNGETACISEWSKRTGIPYQNITARLGKGWTVEKTLTQPVRRMVKKEG